MRKSLSLAQISRSSPVKRNTASHRFWLALLLQSIAQSPIWKIFGGYYQSITCKDMIDTKRPNNRSGTVLSFFYNYFNFKEGWLYFLELHQSFRRLGFTWTSEKAWSRSSTAGATGELELAKPTFGNNKSPQVRKMNGIKRKSLPLFKYIS